MVLVANISPVGPVYQRLQPVILQGNKPYLLTAQVDEPIRRGFPTRSAGGMITERVTLEEARPSPLQRVHHSCLTTPVAPQAGQDMTMRMP